MALSIREIREKMDACIKDELPAFLEQLLDDERKGVIKLVSSAQKKLEAFAKEEERLKEMMAYERSYRAKGYTVIGGTDEAGRGPLAGPVCAAVVVLPQDCMIWGINDSKKLSGKKREELYDVIRQEAIDYGIAMVSPQRIDEINILQATYEAMKKAIEQLKNPLDFLLADAVTIPGLGIPQEGIIKGDAKSMSIAAASILAKVERDRWMVQMDEMYPAYGFMAHKGYGSKSHIEAIEKHGICPIHRRSFVKHFVDAKGRPISKTKGNLGEEIAARELEKKGYQMIERNYRGQHGEIDIIAKKNTYMVFIEVKYRTSLEMGTPGEAVDIQKQQRIKDTALQYIANWGLTELDFRFDVVEILDRDGKKMFRHIENAFE